MSLPLILVLELLGKKLLNIFSLISYGITPRVMNGQKPRIEVFNPVEDNDDQKTPTAILFDNNCNFLAFGSRALQKYAEIVDDGETAMLFQTVKKYIL